MPIYKNRIIEKKLTELFAYYPVVAVFDPVVDIGNARQDPDFFLQNNKTPAFFR